MGFYACQDSNGVVIFYHSAINNSIPSGAIAITDDQFNQAMQVDRQYVSIVNGELVINTPPQPTDAELLAQAQQAQKVILQQERDQAIYAGFTSSVTGHQYGYAPDDQVNLLKQTVRLMNDSSITSVVWNTLDAGLVTHTSEEFLSLQQDAQQHEMSLYEKYWTKEAQIDKCTTVEEVQSIVWDDTTPPAVPTGLTATPVTQGADLEWTPNTDITLGGYNVYQSNDGGTTWTKINTSLVTTNSYSVTGLTSGTTYEFAVTAVNTDGYESAQSTPVSVTAE